MPIQVSIVEDDSGFRESLSALINKAKGFRCLSAFPNAEIALKQMPSQWPDVLLMDINLPEMSGIECVSKLKALRSGLQIIMLTAYVENEKIFDSLMAGASGYLIKRTQPAQIIEAIAEVHRGGSPMSGQIARKVVQYVQQLKQPAPDDAKLSPREQEVLNLLAEGFHYKEIADKLSISLETVRVHIRHVYEKLQVHSRTEAVVKFLGKRKPF
jgi:DNA-binding NarL/FixJ family response regulator